jgi:hypothetical protein
MEFEEFERRIRQAESGGKLDAIGDHGRALGAYQMHNEFRKQWYEKDDFIELQTVDYGALQAFWEACHKAGLSDDEMLASYHLHGMPTKGAVDPEYVKRVMG